MTSINLINRNGKAKKYSTKILDLYKIAMTPEVQSLRYGDDEPGAIAEEMIEAWHMLHDLTAVVTAQGEARLTPPVSESYTYWEVRGTLDGLADQLFGSYDRTDCVYELDAERETWKEQGYRKIHITSVQTTQAPDPVVYEMTAPAERDDDLGAEMERAQERHGVQL